MRCCYHQYFGCISFYFLKQCCMKRNCSLSPRARLIFVVVRSSTPLFPMHPFSRSSKTVVMTNDPLTYDWLLHFLLSLWQVGLWMSILAVGQIGPIPTTAGKRSLQLQYILFFFHAKVIENTSILKPDQPVDDNSKRWNTYISRKKLCLFMVFYKHIFLKKYSKE
jgi:hypothetical protein